MMHIEDKKRKSFMDFEQPYFYTATILHWHKLLIKDKYKNIILESLKYLFDKKFVKIYGLVIMPNHIHLIWELMRNNGKEKPNASFLKFTAHAFKKDLELHHPQIIPFFETDKTDRKIQFWQSDSLAIALNSREICEQKLDYIHQNPLHQRWNLASRPEEYTWSSATFYEKQKDSFAFLTHYLDRF